MPGRILLVLALTLGAAACSGELTLRDGGDLGGGGGGGGGGGDDMTAARQLWESDVLPLMTAARPKGACVACHQGTSTAGPAFLGPTQATNFDTLVGGALIGGTPGASKFLTIGEHTGNGFCTGVGAPVAQCTTNEEALVSNWILSVNGS